MSRYETLNVSLQTDNRNLSRLSQTLDVDNSRDDESQRGGQTDERVRKFRELYYRNEKLRKQLKILNMKLNEKLEKVKLPNVKKRAASVDLNYNPPNKAMQRELDNAVKQVKMYKKQVQILKVKQESAENYARYRDLENMVAYKDKEIYEVQQKIISAKNIKKSQERQIHDELENQQVKQRIENYQAEHKQLKEKLKQIAKKSRKRQEEYKKQQAYLVSLQKKVRVMVQEEKRQEEEFSLPKVDKQKIDREVTEKEFRDVKEQIANQKKINDELLVKIQVSKKAVLHWKRQQTIKQDKLKEKEASIKLLQTKIMALHRLLRQQDRKQRQQLPPPNKLITNIQEEDIELNDGNIESQEQNQSPREGTLNGLLHQLQNISGGEGLSKNSNNRSWKGKFRKIQHGFGGPSDKKYQFQGYLIGFNVSLDENEAICGLSFIFSDDGKERTSDFLGNHSNVELKWVCDKFDEINKISGSFTEQSYLNELIVTTKNGRTGVFGASSSDPFMFILKPGQKIQGCFGSMRAMGKDVRITQFGFWVGKQ